MSLAFDPDDYDYGPASPAIRRILRSWASVDWFAPTGATDEELMRSFTDHNALAYRQAPEIFAPEISLRVELGGWPEFIQWCARVRSQRGWDWKFGALKKLSSQHAKVHGWTIEREAQGLLPNVQQPGALFLLLDNGKGTSHVLWNTHQLVQPSLDQIRGDAAREAAQFWLEYERMDLLCAVQWELAEPTSPNNNPFVPLHACTRAGGYPFALRRDEVVLFRFAADQSALPTARVV